MKNKIVIFWIVILVLVMISCLVTLVKIEGFSKNKQQFSSGDAFEIENMTTDNAISTTTETTVDTTNTIITETTTLTTTTNITGMTTTKNSETTTTMTSCIHTTSAQQIITTITTMLQTAFVTTTTTQITDLVVIQPSIVDKLDNVYFVSQLKGTYYLPTRAQQGKILKGGSGRYLIDCSKGDSSIKGSVASSYFYSRYGYNYNNERTLLYLEVEEYPEMNGYYYLDDSNAAGIDLIDFFFYEKDSCPFSKQGVVTVKTYIVNY